MVLPGRDAQTDMGKDITCYLCGCALVEPPSQGETFARNVRTRDHVIPKSIGWNLTKLCCWECNIEKGNKMPGEYVKFLVVKRRTLINPKRIEENETKIKNMRKALKQAWRRVIS